MPRLKRVDRYAVVPAFHAETSSRWARPYNKIARTGEIEEGACSLPKHLWWWVAQYNDVADSATTLQCSAWLLGAFEVEALWLHHCLTNDFTRPATGPDSNWIYPFLPAVKVSRCINWRQLLQVNMQLRSWPSVWVRVCDVDLRLPVRAEAQSSVAALTADLGHVVSIEAGSETSLHMQLVTLEEGREKPRGPSAPRWSLRLRRLQWAGRPGAVMQEGASLAGGRFLLEWAQPAWRGWPLPPVGMPARESARSHSSAPLKFRYQGMPVFSWLHAGGSSTVESSVPAALSAEECEGVIMIRVLSLLVPRELWLCVSMDATVGNLYQEIAKVLRRESPLLADLCRPIKYHLMDPQSPRRKAAVMESKPLRELFWAQSETVRAELESASSQKRLHGAGQSQHTSAAAGSYLALLIWREQAFVETPALSSDCPALQSCFSPVSGWTRQVSEPTPVRGRGWARQVSEPMPALGSQFTRQMSDPIPAAEEWGREVSEPPPLPSLPNSSWFPSSGHCSVQPEASTEGAVSSTAVATSSESSSNPLLHAASGHPGDLALDCLEELPLTPGEGSNRASSSGGPSWERIVPHYPPQLLPRTLLTRQFEFHPTLPEVLLTGDKKGSVNILNIESGDVHPPLVVGVCPLLGLVWMRHHPQKAICGASHSGKIMFLRYDPDARPAEPALQRLQTVEDFPKLSSLSSNCTDDFLLASGISPNVAVYDVQTGKVLHRAHGVHEHFINISRFCHNSPHIFATASFDHTCKVWDLRQPLMPNLPVKTLNTGSHNVMCVFSPDDKHVLCSGVDTRIMQFEVPSWRQTPELFPLREPVHRERYRRSTYLATGQHFVTAATEESHMHLMSVDGKKLGVVDFRGVVQEWADKGSQGMVTRRFAAEPCCLQVPRLAMHLESRILAARAPWPFATPHRGNSATCQEQTVGPGLCAVGQPHQELVQGTVQLDDADPNGGSSRNNHEFIQSIRTHPMVKNRVGVLLSLTQAEQSYVALVDMDPRIVGG